MEELNITTGELIIDIVLTIIGMLSFVLLQLITAKKKNPTSFNIRIYFELNWMELLLSALICIGLFIGMYVGGNLTVERCLMIGVTVSLLVNKLKKAVA